MKGSFAAGDNDVVLRKMSGCDEGALKERASEESGK